MFLGWYDDTPKKSAEQKIEEAIERFVSKFGEQPDVCLVNAANMVGIEGIEVKTASYVRPNHFWVGKEEAPVGASLAA